MIDETTPTVSAAEFVRHFARYRDAAHQSPVAISNHRRTTHVLLDVAAYRKLTEATERHAGADELGLMFSLAEWMDEAVIVCDDTLKVLFANRTAQAITHRPSMMMVDKTLLEALPQIAGSVMEVHARRTTVGSEPSSADIPSPFDEGSWLRFHGFRLTDHIILKFHDITEDVERHHLADIKEAILQGMAVHGEIGYVRLSVRGTIDRVDQPFCDMVGLPESRLEGVLFIDLADISCRAALREQLEGVLRGEGSVKMQTRMVSNKGDPIAVKMSLTQLQSAYGAEGAIVMLTPLQEADS